MIEVHRRSRNLDRALLGCWMLEASRGRTHLREAGRSHSCSTALLVHMIAGRIEWHILVVEVDNILALRSCMERSWQLNRGDPGGAGYCLAVPGCSRSLPYLIVYCKVRLGIEEVQVRSQVSTPERGMTSKCLSKRCR